MSCKRVKYWLAWKGESLEQSGRIWAAAGLEPSVGIDHPCLVGDVLQVLGSKQPMIVIREVGAKERRERSRKMGVVMAGNDLPYCYLVHTD